MTVRKRLTAKLAAVSAAAIGLASGVLADPALATTAPQCISTSTQINGIWKTFAAYNGCSSSYNIRFIIAFHADSGCYTLHPDQGMTVSIILSPAYLERLDLC